MRVLLLLAIAALVDPSASYRAEIEKYRRDRVAELTAPNGWLAVQGLFWLHEGQNTAGSDPASEIPLPGRAPKRPGVVPLARGHGGVQTGPAAHGAAAGEA